MNLLNLNKQQLQALRDLLAMIEPEKEMPMLKREVIKIEEQPKPVPKNTFWDDAWIAFCIISVLGILVGITYVGYIGGRSDGRTEVYEEQIAERQQERWDRNFEYVMVELDVQHRYLTRRGEPLLVNGSGSLIVRDGTCD